jgi:hypothetical protein
MWSTLMVGAIFTAFHPVRLAVVALLISRPRPVASLFAYWLGALIAGIPLLLVPLVVLHSTPTISSATQNLATSTTFRHIQVGIGVLAISIAVLMIVRSSKRQRVPAASSGHRTPSRVGNTSTLEVEPNTVDAVSRLLGGGSRVAAVEDRSPVRRMLDRAHNSWENGSSWVAGLLGMVMGGPSLDGVFFGLAIIVTSGASIGEQISAAIVSVFVMLAVVEVILLSSLVTPARTEAALRVVHDWVQSHRRKILIILLAVVGAALVAQGAGVI